MYWSSTGACRRCIECVEMQQALAVDWTAFIAARPHDPSTATAAGEVCFPGGKREPGDADDISTALREAQVRSPCCCQTLPWKFWAHPASRLGA